MEGDNVFSYFESYYYFDDKIKDIVSIFYGYR